MSEERRERAREILQCALAKKSDERTQFLRDACHAHPRGRASDTAKAGLEPMAPREHVGISLRIVKLDIT